MVMRKDNQMLKRVNLAGRIDRSANADEADTMQTKRALRALGYYSTPAYGMTPYPDEPLFEGIKSYQRANKLKIDGDIGPKTEGAFTSALADHGADKVTKRNSDDLGGGFG